MGNEGGEQEVILQATHVCSDTEWEMIREALPRVCAERSIKFEE